MSEPHAADSGAPLRTLLPLERRVMLNRLKAIDSGRLPRWNQQMTAGGRQAVGYTICAAFWVQLGAILVLTGLLLLILSPPRAWDAVGYLCFAGAAVLLILTATRLFQAWAATRRYRRRPIAGGDSA